MFTEPFSCANLDGAFGGDSGHTSALPQSLQSVKSCLRLSTLSVRCLIADTHVDHYRAEARRSRVPEDSLGSPTPKSALAELGLGGPGPLLFHRGSISS